MAEKQSDNLLTREDWIWILIVISVIGLLVLRALDKLSEPNFMELLRYIIVAALSILSGIGITFLALMRLKLLRLGK